MSKRKKLRKALKALGAGLAIAGLGRAFMNRNRTGTEFPRPKAGTIDQMAKDMTVATPKVYDDPIMTGGKGVKPAKVFPRLKVTDRGNVIRDGVDTGVGNPKTKFVSGKNIFIDGKPFTKATLKAKREMDAGMLPPQLRVPKAPRVLDPMEQFVMDNPLDVSAKDGGRIVKGEKKAVRPKKKTRIQIRGFGKARK